MYATFQYCLANGDLGVGWRVDEINESTDWEVTITAPETDVDLYAEVSNQVAVSIEP